MQISQYIIGFTLLSEIPLVLLAILKRQLGQYTSHV